MRIQAATALVALALAGVARADDPAARARELDRRFKTLFAEGDYLAAAAAEEQAYALEPLPDAIFNVAEALALGGDDKRAIASYEKYIELGAREEKRQEALARIRELTATGPAADRRPPRIVHQPLTQSPRRAPLLIAAKLDDPSGIAAATLSYRLPHGEYVSAALIPSGASWSAAIPPVDAEFVDYYLECYDKLGNGPARSGTPTYPHRVRLTLASDEPHPLDSAAPLGTASAAALSPLAKVDAGPTSPSEHRWLPSTPAGTVLAGASIVVALAAGIVLATDGRTTNELGEVQHTRSQAVVYGAWSALGLALAGAGGAAWFELRPRTSVDGLSGER